jgi:RNA-directed DNA polymerase
MKVFITPVRESLNHRRHLTVTDAVAALNPILRGWVNYFRVGNSAPAFHRVKDYVAMRVRRFAAKQLRRGFGWKRWSIEVVYKKWGLFDEYKVHYYGFAKVAASSKGIINPV